MPLRIYENGNVRSSSSQKFSSFLVALGGFVLLSALLVNPWIGRFYRGNIVNFHDVMAGYFVWAMVLGCIMVGSGLLVRRWDSGVSKNMILVLVSCALIVLSDRLLLAKFGLTLWMADLANHYKHRPNAVRSWGSLYENKLIRINAYGYHDDDFPLKKGEHEFRAVMLGDSVTMGHAVTRDEAFPNQLEALLNAKDGTRSFQIINTGVQGYGTFQEYNAFKDSLVFEPDFAAIGFCMNDLSEPFVVDKRLGGVGLDYHGVTQASSILASYLLNETGYGRLLQYLRTMNESVEVGKMHERFSVKKISQVPVSDPAFSENWRIVLSDLDKVYALAKKQHIPIVLLIFPFTFQLLDEAYRVPQTILTAHARSRDVDVIDFTKVFAPLIFDAKFLNLLRQKGFSEQEIMALYRQKIEKYFLDEDHYTVEGHKVIAAKLADYLVSPFYILRTKGKCAANARRSPQAAACRPGSDTAGHGDRQNQPG